MDVLHAVAAMALTLTFASYGSVEPLGPHGGALRQSEGIGTELVLVPKVGARIYLQGAEAAASTDGVRISFNVTHRGREVDYACQTKPDYFECRFPQATPRAPGDRVILRVTRNNTTGTFFYKFPLATAPSP